MVTAALIAAACGGSGDDADASVTATEPAAQQEQSSSESQEPAAQETDSDQSVAQADDAAAAPESEDQAEADGAQAATDEEQAEQERRSPAPPVQLDVVQVAVWGESGGFDRPNHIDVGPDGNVYLTEFTGSRVFKFSPEGEELARWGGPGTAPGLLQAPTGIAVDADGFVYVAESGGSRVQKFTADGELVLGWGSSGTEDGQFISAMGIDISADGRVYVADWGNARVQVFTTEGVFLFAFSRSGVAPGEMVAPIGLDLDIEGNVLVVDSGNARVQKFDPEGELLEVYNVGQTPQVISARPEGGWYLSDPAAARIFAFNAAGERLSVFPLDVSYAFPHGTATGLDGAVYLADTGNNVVRKFLPSALADAGAAEAPRQVPVAPDPLVMQVFPVPAGSRPHDVAPAADGGVWYTAQGAAALGWLDPATGATRHIDLGAGSRPHGVIVGPDGAAWVTDSGLNAIVRVDAATDQIDVYPLPPERPNANLNTATFGGDGRLWFTGQNGIIGRLDPASGAMDVFDAPRGRGPYGIAIQPWGEAYFAPLAVIYRPPRATLSPDAAVFRSSYAGQGARRVWSDSQGQIWVSEWNGGALGRYDPADGSWMEWTLPTGVGGYIPAPDPRAYAVYVDDEDAVWVSDFGANAIHRFDPKTKSFETFSLPSQPGNVRQILGRPGEVWAPESAADQLIVIRRGLG